MNGAHNDDDHKWSIGFNNRYFKSYKHFVGTTEQKERVEAGTEVINHTFATEVNVSKRIDARWSVGIYMPMISNTRSSMYEHYGNGSASPNARRTTKSFGLGDVRIAAYYWLTDPAINHKANIQLGVGVKLPTGDYRYQDYFYRNDSTKILGPVDQSIQLGDGGTGFSAEYNGFYNVAKKLSVYTNGYYLFNPREQNGVSTTRGAAASATAIAYGSDVMSVPDQFMFRLGANFTTRQLMLSAGVRVEGVPAKDIIGGSNGFRRPGYVVSAEPVVAYTYKRSQWYISVPYALSRNRTQSVPDKIRTEKTGVYAQGDAAFADYSLNMGVAFKF